MDPDLIGKVGLPIALAVVLVAFFGKSVWPWITKRVEVADARTDAANARTDTAIAAFAGIKETLGQNNEIHRQMVSAMDELIRRGKQ